MKLKLKLLIFAGLVLVGVLLLPKKKEPEAPIGTSSDLPGASSTGGLSNSDTAENQKPAPIKLIVKEPSPQEKKRTEQITQSFTYQDEIQKVELLQKSLPESKPELVKIITAPNPFKKEKLITKIHSIEEITKRQMDAIKILSLKTLIDNEKSKQILVTDLNHIIRSAEDKQIKELAMAARESVNSGKKATSTKKQENPKRATRL